jgi:hypothetical protein
MNQASWRRILQRAGDELPAEGAAIINMQDHVPGGRRGRHPQESQGSDAADLDYQLSRALDRAASRNRAPGQPTPPPPSAPLTARNPYVSMQPVPVPLPPQNIKKNGSGARNVVAISLSVAVVGLAFHQISAQWSESRTAGGKQEEMAQVLSEARLPAVVYTGASAEIPGRPAEDSSRSARTNSNRVDLRPSYAEPASTNANADASDRQALYAEMEQAVKSYLEREGAGKKASSNAIPANSPAQPKERLAANTPAQPIAGTNSEQIVLRRGRERMERGDVAGARLIFEHLAAQNSALGAFALAQTYDPRYINQNSLSGATPDEEVAARWYQRAVELGSGG